MVAGRACRHSGHRLFVSFIVCNLTPLLGVISFMWFVCIFEGFQTFHKVNQVATSGE